MSDPAPVGVLLAQLGTPDAPTTAAVRRYLAHFLADRRVVDLSPWLWRPILHGVVLRVRPRRSAALYRNVWTPEGSPLLVHSRAQAAGVQERLGAGYRVELGMRIGNPPLADALDRLLAAGCRRVVVLPLFPQASSATTGSVFDALAEWARARLDLPDLRFVRGFADHPGWIAAWVARVRAAGVTPSRAAPLLISFHGLPRKRADAGDPYPAGCRATAAALVKALALPDDAWRIVYQSRFGRAEWLRPYATDVLAALPREGIKQVSVLPASFVADCLETLDELGRDHRERFLAAGGTDYTLIPCPNAVPPALEALADLVRAHG